MKKNHFYYFLSKGSVAMATTFISYDGPSKFAPLRNFPFQIKLYNFRSGAKGNILVYLKKLA